ncbi:MAG: hypothetical protein M3Y28_04705 [Armatimonadota bacterium]|nr:hypothetical protein [Armatimonadota bacterium]
MLIQYSRRAQGTFALAWGEAGRRGAEIIGTEHLLLALLADTYSVAWRVMDRLGDGTEAIRADLQAELPAGDGEPSALDEDVPLDLLPLTPEAQRAVEVARVESRRMEEYSVGTGHLLLGLLAEAESLAALSLARHAVDPARVRQEMAREQEL